MLDEASKGKKCLKGKGKVIICEKQMIIKKYKGVIL